MMFGTEQPAQSPGEPMYRIGAQVHDHEARIRMLERDSVVLSEGMKQLKESITGVSASVGELKADLHDHINGLRETLDEHVIREDADRAKLIASSIGQIIAVVIGVLLVMYGK